ncbi:aldo/keto reductase [Jatrophihabitans sp.]|uniref:aldo/keto reductase n=1 Tax=Jatrophihabitans sp. TaxID=1932789 RepID=UPI0030C66DBF|nr:aldo/keto reductase [Jatrophihabitans sp.]
MRYTVLGRTGLRVSSLCLGTAWFGVAPPAADVGALVGRALDAGVNFFDTASTYGNQSRFDRPGQAASDARESAEELLGRALRGHRDEVVLATKVGERSGPGHNDVGVSREHVERMVERSLRRLATDRVDILYVHHPDPGTGMAELATTFDRLIGRGLIRHWGLSNFTAEQTMELHETARRHSLEPPVVQQLQYNLARRSAERDLLPTVARYESAAIAYAGLAGGLLGGSAAARRRFSGAARIGRAAHSPAQLAVADGLQRLADAKGEQPGRLALGWLLSRPGVVATVVGPESAEEFSGLVRDLDDSLPRELLTEIDALTQPFTDLS